MLDLLHAIPRKTVLGVIGGACLAAVLLVGVSRTATARASVATAPPVDHQLCYIASGTFKVPATGVKLFDQFNPNGFTPKINTHANLLCNPVQKSVLSGKTVKVLSKITNPRAHLVCNSMTAQETAPPPKVQVTNQFGQAILAPAPSPDKLCIPSWKSLTGPLHIKPTTPPNLNHFTCYRVSLVSGAYKPPPGLMVRDEFTKKNVKVAVNPKPQELCVPAKKMITVKGKVQTYPIVNPDQHLLCYVVTKTPVRPRVWAENQFGMTAMKVGPTHWLCVPSEKKIVPADCAPSSSLNVLTNGTNVTAYVPKGSWAYGGTGVSAVNVEGSSITPTLIPTTSVVNSCASNSITGTTYCTGNDASVYVFNGTTLSTTLTSGGTSFIGFSGGSCTNCGIAMDALHNRALIGLSNAGAPSFQFLNLGSNTFGSFLTSQSNPAAISEDPLVDPSRNLLLSANESGTYEIVDISNPGSPKFYENVTGQVGEMDSSAEDCSTGIALAPEEFTSPSTIYIADLTQATFTAGSPAGTWSAPSQHQSLSNSNLAAGPTGIAIAQGTHLGVVTGEFGGDQITAIRLPATSGSGTPAIQDWVSCQIPATPDTLPWSEGYDPHTVAAYRSPTTGDAMAVLGNSTWNWLARIDLTKLLNTGVVPRTGGDTCTSGTLPGSVVSFIPVP